MQIKLGAKVYGSDDKQVGTVNNVILYPGTKELTHLVLHNGQGASSETPVPVESIYSADEKRVVLRQSSQDLAQVSGTQSAEAVATQNAPDGTVMLKAGAKVISSDGQHVGDVERVTTSENIIVELLITKGKLLKSRKLIQTDMISSILENEVRLNVDAAFIHSLPEPRPEMMM